MIMLLFFLIPSILFGAAAVRVTTMTMMESITTSALILIVIIFKPSAAIGYRHSNRYVNGFVIMFRSSHSWQVLGRCIVLRHNNIISTIIVSRETWYECLSHRNCSCYGIVVRINSGCGYRCSQIY
ncbi:hypothetical protein BDB00DRAFT_812542 [Zychaea mexicana]|uniref:uncharacterized protein n=1 Tax=Zychaea mexicana TaxID=64656 RepID=UPI0022FF30AA|nr:uncharacterized protein BDB00DRAFT_812542 [Zychaea mexicana]KAI9495585.1 hypothetical protein BDB00DRAFT_812542 [Zychaea mexicana]